MKDQTYTIEEICKLVNQVARLDAELQEARESAEEWRDNFMHNRRMSMVVSTKLPWEERSES